MMSNKEKTKMIDIAKEMIRDYLYYGYGLKTWVEQDYEITKCLGIDKIKELFKEVTIEMGSEF